MTHEAHSMPAPSLPTEAPEEEAESTPAPIAETAPEPQSSELPWVEEAPEAPEAEAFTFDPPVEEEAMVEVVEQPANDLFGDEPKPMVDSDPVAEEPTVIDAFADEPPMEEDPLFGDMPEDAEDAVVEETPANDLFADEPSDDLFGDQPAEEASDGLFGETTDEPVMPMTPDEEPAPTEEAAPVVDATPSDDVDLFGGFGEEPATEAVEEPAMEPAADELFGEEPAEEALEEPAFEEPAAEESAAEESTEETEKNNVFGAIGEEDLFGGDLFGDSPATPPTPVPPADPLDAAPAEEPAVEEPEQEEDFSEDEDDLFGGFGAILSEPGGYDSTALRSWVDNSGRFSCVARLVDIDGDKVTILKDNGKTATLGLSRLSQRDLEFVNRQALAMQQVGSVVVAQR